MLLQQILKFWIVEEIRIYMFNMVLVYQGIFDIGLFKGLRAYLYGIHVVMFESAQVILDMLIQNIELIQTLHKLISCFYE